MPVFWKKDPFKPLKKAIGKEKVYTLPEDLALYSIDASHLQGAPCAVVLPENAADLQKIVRFASETGIHITPRGAGSGLSGGSVPEKNSVVVSCERMTKIEKIDHKDKIAIVEPGVVTEQLQRKAAEQNLYYPPDPSSNSISAIGGNVAENAGGLRCFKYGVTGQYVLGAEFINSQGEIVRTGYFGAKIFEPDITGLIIGSEGTLGIISKIALRLIPLPENTITILCSFKESEECFETVESIIAHGVVPSVLEFIDHNAIQAALEYSDITLTDAVKGILLMELDGSAREVSEFLHHIKKILGNSVMDIKIAQEKSERDSLWNLRRSISPSLIRLSTGKLHEDIAVPRGKISETYRAIKEAERSNSVWIAVYGHAGDGNLHVVILFDAGNRNSVSNAKKASEEIFRYAIKVGGTISGEHGIGIAKRNYLSWQFPERNIKYMHQIKEMFDPNCLFNPGKILKQ